MNQIRPLNYRFGDYELRVESETLLKNGVPVPLQRLPLLMLTMLLEHPHQVVTREALQSRLWGPQGYLQFENGLRVAAAKLREALGDTAASPIFIKTIPRLGYQFVAEDLVVIDPWTAPATPAKSSESALGTNAVSSNFQRRKSDLSILRRRKSDLSFLDKRRYATWQLQQLSSRLQITICVAAIAITAGVALAWIYRLRHDTRVAAGQTVMLGSFYNQTPDPQMSGLYDFPFHMKMQESEYLHMVEAVDQTQTTEQSSPMSIPDELSRCRSAKARVLLTGVLEARGKGYTIRLSSWDCASNRLLKSETAFAEAPTSILAALDIATVNLRHDLGESADSLSQLATPSAQATSSSIAALRAFHMGEAKRSASSLNEAIAYYKLATDLDPQFAIAFDRLGMAYAWIAQMGLSKQALTAAFRLRDHATDHERLSITSHYYDGVTYDLPLAKQTYELWIRMYPNDSDPMDTLSDIYLKATGEPRKALTLEERAVTLNPTSVESSLNLAEAHLELNDATYLNNYCKDNILQDNNKASMQVFCYLSFFNQKDEPSMQRELELATGDMNQGMLLDESGAIALQRGQIGLAKQLFSSSRKSLLKIHLNNFAAWVQSREAVLEATLGLKEIASHDALSALQIDRNPGTLGLGAWILASTGDRTASVSMAKEASDMSPADTLLNLQILGCANAVLALESHNPKETIQALDAGRPYAFGTNTYLAPNYYRGLAMQEQHDWKASVNEFQSLLDHKYVLSESLFVALTELELGHSYKELGDDAHAAPLFHELDLLWAQADPAFEPAQRLKRYEKLRQN